MKAPDFDGLTYVRDFDHARLTGQLRRVATLMRDGTWRTLDEIRVATGDRSSASISARLRDLRKTKFGGFNVQRRSRGGRIHGLFEYRLGPALGIVTAEETYGGVETE